MLVSLYRIGAVICRYAPIERDFALAVNNIFDNYQSVMSCDLLPAQPLDPNPVWRSYRGGRILRAFRGQPNTTDDHFPEDWLASTVLARNGENSQGAREGLSRISNANGDWFIEALKQRPTFWFGPDQASRQDLLA